MAGLRVAQSIVRELPPCSHRALARNKSDRLTQAWRLPLARSWAMVHRVGALRSLPASAVPQAAYEQAPAGRPDRRHGHKTAYTPLDPDIRQAVSNCMPATQRRAASSAASTLPPAKAGTSARTRAAAEFPTPASAGGTIGVLLIASMPPRWTCASAARPADLYDAWATGAGAILGQLPS